MFAPCESCISKKKRFHEFRKTARDDVFSSQANMKNARSLFEQVGEFFSSHNVNTLSSSLSPTFRSTTPCLEIHGNLTSD